MQNSRPVHLNKGFTYLAILFAIAIMGIALAAAGSLWHVSQQREKERELLYIGNQYRQAITLYYERSPGGGKQFPKSLENLLQDNRQLVPQRYLRKLFRDPITNSKTWGLVAGPGNSIMGVYSLSEDTPIKQGNFDKNNLAFAGAQHYSDWKFVYVIQTPLGLPVQGLPALK
ncbi:type II secretion system protein [Sulfuriferula thiophila]|uniref:type II secretion system protein n=1 Tax=Sulfuriferula thiophila TaxID=1781211 RepID=UPI000F60B041|nr:type II secretion system protein [Sulfuriferula thiophila]